MSKKWFVALATAAAMTMSAGALAQATVPGFYVGLDVGQTDVGDEDDTGFKIFGGYQFHRNFAAELGYGMLFDKEGVELTSLEAVAVGMFPVAPQISIIGKLGFAMLEAEAGGQSEDETEFTIGVGVQWDATRNLGVRLQWQRYMTDPDDIDYISAGIVFRF